MLRNVQDLAAFTSRANHPSPTDTFPEAREEIDLLTIQHGYWRVDDREELAGAIFC